MAKAVPAIRRLVAISLAVLAFTCGFVAGELIDEGRLELLLDTTWWEWRSASIAAVFGIALLAFALVLEFCGSTLAIGVVKATRRTRAFARRKWKGDRTSAEYARAENGIYLSLTVVLCIATLYFMPLATFAFLMMCLALFVMAWMVVSTCRTVNFSPVLSILFLTVYGVAAGYWVGL